MKTLQKLKQTFVFLIVLTILTPLAQAGWLRFSPETLLNESQQSALIEQLTQEVLQGLAVLAEGLSDSISIQENCHRKLKSLLKSNSDQEQDVIVKEFWKQVFCKALFAPKRKDIDKEYATNPIVNRRYELQTPNKYFLNAVCESDSELELLEDGILNQILREIVRNKLGEWSQEQINEAFEVLWDLFSNDRLDISDKKSPEEILHIIGSLQEAHPVTASIINNFLKTPGNIVEKIATFLADTLVEQLESQQAQKCGCGCGCLSWLTSCCTPECMKKTGDISLTALQTAAKLTPTILQIVALILKATAI